MERLGVLRTRIGSIAQLQEVVGAMRSLAAVRMQQAAELLGGARRYADIVAGALSQALLLAGAPPPVTNGGGSAVLLFSAEHGFVGGYAEVLARTAAALPAPTLYAVGARGARALAEMGRPPVWSAAMTTHAAGIAALARRVAGGIVERFHAGEFTHLDVMFGRLEEGGRWGIATEPLLPPDFTRFRPPPAQVAPLHHLPAAELLAGLVEEYLLAGLVRVATEALAAENAARLQAMTTAADNIERKLDELRGQERILRQEQITEELLDVLNGAEALSRPTESPRPAKAH